jgi:hypothetical protein
MLLLISALNIFAQQKQLLIDPVKDRKEKNGYTIQLKMALNNTILFDLLQAGKSVFKQPINPLTRLPIGFDNKEDAWRVANWMIDQYGKEGHFPSLIPPNVARQLNVRNINTQPLPVN